MIHTLSGATMHGWTSRWCAVVALSCATAGCSDPVGHAGDDGAGSSGALGTAGDSVGSSSGADGSSGDPDNGPPAVDAAPGGLRRLRADQYTRTILVLLGQDAAAAAAPPSDQSLLGFQSVGATQGSLSPSEIEQYEASALAVARAAVASPYTLSTIVPCVSDGPQDEGCYVKVAEDFARVAWRREVTSDELDRLVDIARAGRTFYNDSFSVGLEYELAMILESPAFIYSVELGEVRDDGKRWLTTTEWLTRASLFMLGRAPSAEELARARSGDLDGEDAPRALATEWLSSADARRAGRQFFDELLRAREVLNKSKDPVLYPLFTPEMAASMREETLRLAEDVAFGADGERDLRRLLDADYTWVDARLAQLYGLEAPASGGFERVDLPASSGRRGVLTHGSMLAVGSHPDRNSPTRRGLFVQRSLMCTEVPPPPGDVNTTLPEPTEPTTLRARMEQHMNAGGACEACHVQTDPVGFAFEFFDASGLRRELDNGFAIDASGDIPGIGKFEDAVELALLLSEDPRFGPCVVRNLYRHAVGHGEDDGVRDALGYMNDRFTAADHDFHQLIVDMIDNPAFRQVGEPQ